MRSRARQQRWRSSTVTVLLTTWTACHAAPVTQRSILFVASHHELRPGGHCSLVDPQFKAELTEHGWVEGYATLLSLRWEWLTKFNVVVLQQHPDVERFRLDDVFEGARELIQRYVEAGGGVFAFADLHRGRIYGNLNKLLKPFGAQFHYQAVEERHPKRRRELANWPAVKAFVTESIVLSPTIANVERLWCPVLPKNLISAESSHAATLS